jgi:hypothetical protein
MQERRLLP